MFSSSIQEFAPAKINLYLHILGRREDGYHNLDSLVVFADIGDRLSLSKSPTYSLELDGPFAPALIDADTADNLVLKAADVVAHCVKEIPPGGDIHLEKNLPISAGIGGGSSDAAACIRGLLKLHKHRLSVIARQQIALAVGSDVSVCLLAKAAKMMGAGHSVEAYSGLPKIYAVLVNPGVEVSTRDIFSQLHIAKGEQTDKEGLVLPAKFKSIQELCSFLEETSNDLQNAAIEQVPIIDNILRHFADMPHCLFARMSGSGASCFGIFPSLKAARSAAEMLHEQEPGWWVQATTLS